MEEKTNVFTNSNDITSTNAISTDYKEVPPKHVSEEEDFSKFKPAEELIRLDLGCGSSKREGFLGVDKARLEGVDIVYDLEVFPWPFVVENSVFEIFCSHYVEHTKDLIGFMKECYRILMPQCTVTIVAPYCASIRAFQDPTHVRMITENTFNYFNREWMKSISIEHYDSIDNCNFSMESLRYYFNPEWVNRGDEAREFARKHYFNVVMDIEFVLRKIGEKK